MNTEEYPHHLLKDFADQDGVSIHDHSFAAPMLLVLIRHVGCAFCRKTLYELSQSLEQITSCGYEVGLVHMDADDHTKQQLAIYGLDKLPRFYDPSKLLYQGLGLTRANLRSLFNFRVWSEGFEASRKHGVGWPESDPRQLPGAFLIDQGQVVAGETTLSPHEHPDFLSLLIYSEAVAPIA